MPHTEHNDKMHIHIKPKSQIKNDYYYDEFRLDKANLRAAAVSSDLIVVCIYVYIYMISSWGLGLLLLAVI